MLKLSLARSQREEKTAYLAVRIGDLAGFAALRYDLRHLLRGFCALLAAAAALRTLCRK